MKIKKKKFKLAVFPSSAVDARLADWDGVGYLLETYYPEVWPKILPNFDIIRQYFVPTLGHHRYIVP
jgi:hypothetical protein